MNFSKILLNLKDRATDLIDLTSLIYFLYFVQQYH